MALAFGVPIVLLVIARFALDPALGDRDRDGLFR
jgi:hypothetical protein